MGEIVFVRHGQASFGTDDYDRLSPLGWQQARWLGQHFADEGQEFHLAASGELRRHRETAAAIAETVGAAETVVLPGLDEMDYDQLWQDAAAAGLIATAHEDDPEAFARQVPVVMHGWEHGTYETTHESFADFTTRVHDAVDTLSAIGKSVLVVSSGGPKALMMRRVLELGTQPMVQILLGILNSSYTRFTVREDGLRLAEFNATPHLAGQARAHARTYI